MTTAHRPAIVAAKGGEEQGGYRSFVPSQMRSVKDMFGNSTMKYRKEGQNSLEELKRKDLKAALEEKERKHFLKASKEDFLAEKEEDLRLLEAGINEKMDGGGTGPPRLLPRAIDADMDDEDEDEDESDSDDEEAELLAELARIKREREEEAAKAAAEEAARADRALREEAVHGNPLLQGKLGAPDGLGGSDTTNFALKRRWDDDVVFKNQAKSEPKQQRRFVNDTLRSDFHKRFLERYIK